ncbi:MAG: VOC family protein [Bilifractor sp.]|jgi:glyoxylase I family protein
MARVESIGHAGFTVMDMDRTLHFYCDLLGGKVLTQNVEENDQLARQVMGEMAKDSHGKLKVTMVELGGLQIEFHQYLIPKTEVAFHGDPSRAGSAHIAVNVDNIEEMYEKLKSEGVKFHTGVNDCVRDGEVVWKWVYARDPDNICCEIVQLNKDSNYYKTTYMAQ